MGRFLRGKDGKAITNKKSDKQGEIGTDISINTLQSDDSSILTIRDGLNIDGDLEITGSGTVGNFNIGYKEIPQVASGNVTLALTDSGKHYYSTTSATETLTIPPNSSVAFETGTAIMIVNKGTGNVAVARGSGVALYLTGNSTSANRTVTSYGMATIIKTGTDEWFISGSGVA